MLTKTFVSLFCVAFLISAIYCVGTKIKLQQFEKVDFFEGRKARAIQASCLHTCLLACLEHAASCQAIRYKADGQYCRLLNKWTTVNVTTFYSDKNWDIYSAVVCCFQNVLKIISPYTCSYVTVNMIDIR